MKSILFVITTCVLTAQGCTISISPIARDTHANTYVTPGSVSGAGHKEEAGPEGIRGLDGTSGTESPSGQVMGRSNAVAAPHNAHPYATTSPSKPESFGGKFWENITSNVVDIAAPVILQKLLN